MMLAVSYVLGAVAATLGPCTSEHSGGACAPGATNTAMNLTLVPRASALQKNARCLDGSPPGYYLAKGTSSTSWLIYFKGGGWCYTAEDCAARAKSNLGSTDSAPKQFAFSGLMDSDPKVNPTFAHFNRVILWYCDGASFAGNAPAPATVGNSTIHFRGLSILHAVLDELVSRHGLADATDVLLSGGSAGGLAAFLHADRVAAYLKAVGAPLQRYRAAPVSGFFLLHADANGEATYPNQMKSVYEMQHAEAGVNVACTAALPTAERWKCIFANYSYAYTKAPTFPLQSSLDGWQLRFIWHGDGSCASDHFANCSGPSIANLTGYAAALVGDLKRASKFVRTGEGGFVESCLEHVAAEWGGFNKYMIDGPLERDALTQWWDAPSTSPPMWWLPCQLSATPPHQCMKSCL